MEDEVAERFRAFVLHYLEHGYPIEVAMLSAGMIGVEFALQYPDTAREMMSAYYVGDEGNIALNDLGACATGIAFGVMV